MKYGNWISKDNMIQNDFIVANKLVSEKNKM